MCLTIPGKVVKIGEDKATIEYDGLRKEASTALVKVKKGDYVVIQAGFIISKVPREEALFAIREWKKVMKKHEAQKRGKRQGEKSK